MASAAAEGRAAAEAAEAKATRAAREALGAEVRDEVVKAADGAEGLVEEARVVATVEETEAEVREGAAGTEEAGLEAG